MILNDSAVPLYTSPPNASVAKEAPRNGIHWWYRKLNLRDIPRNSPVSSVIYQVLALRDNPPNLEFAAWHWWRTFTFQLPNLLQISADNLTIDKYYVQVITVCLVLPRPCTAKHRPTNQVHRQGGRSGIDTGLDFFCYCVSSPVVVFLRILFLAVFKFSRLLLRPPYGYNWRFTIYPEWNGDKSTQLKTLKYLHQQITRKNFGFPVSFPVSGNWKHENWETGTLFFKYV